ncbi:MAG: hypothetical protein WDZ76_05725 [Pseudohongiellaceae bacterium]
MQRHFTGLKPPRHRRTDVCVALIVLLLLVSGSHVGADDRFGFDRWSSGRAGFGAGQSIDSTEGWFIGGRPESGGYSIYRRAGRGWQQMPGSGVRMGGHYESPWLVNNRYEIYRWVGNHWQRLPGSAQDVADGWVIGTDRRSGGYSIYRWNGRGWQRMPGGAVEIEGNFEHPRVINNRGETFRWTGSRWLEESRFRRDGRRF